MNALYNKKNKTDLINKIKEEDFQRITLSFYRYVDINNPDLLRDNLYLVFDNIKVLGRIYISTEGINAQISLPEHELENFRSLIYSYKMFENIPFKFAIEEGVSFLKLIIKVKKEIVAYNVPSDEYDMSQTGKHLNYVEFNKAIDENAIVVDMRNFYESEVGMFENALIPDVDTSQELLPTVKELLSGHKSDTILMYCTGGIRCEKASSYLIHHGFKDVNQLEGGIIKYASDIKEKKETSKFIGKNFVFDGRLGERISDEIISKCHQCGKVADTHTNCNNQVCHILFIQCQNCQKKYNGCCSEDCMKVFALPIEEQRKIRKKHGSKISNQHYKRVRLK